MSTNNNQSYHPAVLEFWGEPMVEFFPRNGEPDARYFWPNAEAAARIAKIKTEMLERQLREAR